MAQSASPKPTAFQMKVYEATQRIPKGKVSTYAQVAQTIGPLRRVLAPNTPEHAQARFLLLTQTDSDVPVLIQKDM